MKVLPILLALSGLSLGSVDEFTACLNGVQTAISYLTWNVTDPEDYYVNGCTNKLLVSSMWAAAKVYCTAEQIEAGSVLFGGYCTEYGGVELIPYSDVLPVLTNDYIKSLPIARYSDLQNLTVFNTPVLISRSFYKAAKDTSVGGRALLLYMMFTDTGKLLFDVEYVLHARYGYVFHPSWTKDRVLTSLSWAMYGFWGGLLLIGIVNNFVSHVLQSRRLKVTTNDEESRSSQPKIVRSGPFAFANSAHHWLRSNIIVPAAYGSHHSRPWLWSTIPTRMETIVIVSFYVMTLILCSVSYFIFSPNL